MRSILTRIVLACAGVVVAVMSTGCPSKPDSQPAPKPVPAPIVQSNPSEATKLAIRASKVLPEDWKVALPQDYSPQSRQGMTDEQLAQDLQLQVWAFDFEGGPLRYWLEFEETEQMTMPAREPTHLPGGWEIDVKEGRLVLSVGLTESDRMKRILKQEGKAESVTFLSHWSYSTDGEGKTGGAKVLHGGSPLWFGWPAENRRLNTETPPVNSPRDGETFTLLRAWCDERVPQQKDKPRRATMLLKGVFENVKQ